MNIVFAGGGTAGHINPALAIAETFRSKNPHCNILFIGNRDSLEDKLVTKAGFDIKYIKVNGIRRSLSPENVKTAYNFLRSVSDCKKIIRDFKADAVIGTGGYVSGPAVYAGHLVGAKCYIHEQNAYPGVTSKFLSRYADIAFLSFEGSEKHFSHAKKIVMTGNPLNENFLLAKRQESRKKLGIPEDAFYVLSFAGSLGAREINKLFIDYICKNAQNKDFVHTHATGSFGFRWMPDNIKERGIDLSESEHIHLLEYIYDMPDRLAASDLVISRAGAITLGEIMALGKPAILIPSPNVTHNHQFHNAMSLVDRDAAMIMEEKDASADKLYEMTLRLKNDAALCKKLGENACAMAKLGASEKIYNSIYTELKK
ncbi:MAG: undecaprenyldiphospho-muramoylpentapeptide beta-N-acetylglucosaminyltransferase [Clostridia bacterium]|nr:undecaprenyldiphospho-muramoylpentapeptide beta-N-acetylglucosaminyltransferase [Clostridia bacterium]